MPLRTLAEECFGARDLIGFELGGRTVTHDWYEILEVRRFVNPQVFCYSDDCAAAGWSAHSYEAVILTDYDEEHPAKLKCSNHAPGLNPQPESVLHC